MPFSAQDETAICSDGSGNQDDPINQSLSRTDRLISATQGGIDCVGTLQGQYIACHGIGPSWSPT
jgi:hypothetical protein